jgi:signal transduction histidine kinase
MLINSNQPPNAKVDSYIKTDTIHMDILNSIGVVGYLKVSNSAILDKMMYQLILSVLLIVIGILSLFYISRSFIFQLKREKMRQDSVNAMTHEFKRPISSAVAMSSLLQYYLEKDETSRVLDYTNNIQLELNKLTEYTKRIQQISNNEKGNLVLNKTSVEIEPFFNSLKERYLLSADNHEKMELELDIATSQKEMCVDLLHFSNVMDNLIENAIKYSDKAVAEITIGVKAVADGLMISVKDNGMGISSTDRKRIFDKFYRVERAETKNKMGFGLGLTYVKSVIDAHGATIEVVSKLNEGSEFVIILKD